MMDGAFDLITEFASDGFAVQPVADLAAEGAFDIAAWIASIRSDMSPVQTPVSASVPAPAAPVLTLVSGDAAATRAARRARILADWDEDLAAERAVTTLRSALRSTPSARNATATPVQISPVATLTSLIPACAAGTRVEADHGPVAIEDIAVGDLVMTRDNGLQPVTSVGRRTVAAQGSNAPVVIAANALGDHGTMTLSQHSQVMLADWRAELLFGTDEVLVRARDLINDTGIRLQSDGGDVTLYHLGFAQPEIIMAEGLAIASGQSALANARTPRMLLDGAEAKVMAAYRM